MGELRRVRERGGEPLLSVVIPSLDGRRNGNLERLIQDLESQTEQDFEILIPVGFKPNGHARNQGVRAAKGQYVVLIDDDVRLGHYRVLEQLVAPFSQVPRIGMTGPRNCCPRTLRPSSEGRPASYPARRAPWSTS